MQMIRHISRASMRKKRKIHSFCVSLSWPKSLLMLFFSYFFIALSTYIFIHYTCQMNDHDIFPFYPLVVFSCRFKHSSHNGTRSLCTNLACWKRILSKPERERNKYLNKKHSNSHLLLMGWCESGHRAVLVISQKFFFLCCLPFDTDLVAHWTIYWVKSETTNSTKLMDYLLHINYLVLVYDTHNISMRYIDTLKID